MPTPQKQLDSFIARFTPDIARLARAALTTMRKRLPGAIEFVYDNAYALVVGFGPTERPSEAIFSIVIHPRKVSLVLIQGASVPDAEGLLQGSGNQVRHIRLEDAKTLDKSGVRALMALALDAGKPLDPTQPSRILIKAISQNQRPRRPAK